MGRVWDDLAQLTDLVPSPAAAVVAECRSRKKHTSGMYAAAALLESYERQIQSIEGRLREADENIDTVREVGPPAEESRGLLW